MALAPALPKRLLLSSYGAQSLDVGLSAFGHLRRSGPNVEVSETDTAIKVSAELPGMDENDVELALANGILTSAGEKISETHDAEKQFSEPSYGRFARRISIGGKMNEDKVMAEFKNALLIVTLANSEEAKTQTRRIAMN